MLTRLGWSIDRDGLGRNFVVRCPLLYSTRADAAPSLVRCPLRQCDGQCPATIDPEASIGDRKNVYYPHRSAHTSGHALCVNKRGLGIRAVAEAQPMLFSG